MPGLNRKVRITAATIRSLQPAPSDWFIRDTEQRGFQIKVPPTGNSIYQVEARFGGTGKVKKFKLGNVRDISLPEARGRAQEALNKIRSGIDPLQEKRQQLHEGMTLGELINAYMNRREYKATTIRDYNYFTNRHFRNWLNRRVTDITSHEIRDWYARGNKTPAHTDGAYRFLNALMRFAMGLEIIDQNPCRLVTNAGMRHRIRPRTRHIEVNEDLGKFLTAFVSYPYLRDSQKVARDVMLLILTTGLRSYEARSIEWNQVSFERKLIIIPDTKNGEPHIVPMTPLIYAIFRYRIDYAEGSQYVFRIKGKSKSGFITDFQKTLSGICKKAEISVVTAHDLRRTFATVLNSLNVGYADMKELMNHKDRDITAGVYIQPDTEKLRKILYQVGEYYDHKIPVFPLGQGCSQFTSNALRAKLYNRGDLVPCPLSDPREEDPDWLQWQENEIWNY